MRGADTKAFLDVREDRVPLLLVRLGDALRSAWPSRTPWRSSIPPPSESRGRGSRSRRLLVVSRARVRLDHRPLSAATETSPTPSSAARVGAGTPSTCKPTGSRRAVAVEEAAELRRRRRWASAAARQLHRPRRPAEVLPIADERHDFRRTRRSRAQRQRPGSSSRTRRTARARHQHRDEPRRRRHRWPYRPRRRPRAPLQRRVLLTQPAPVDEAGGREGSGPRGLAASLEVPTGGASPAGGRGGRGGGRRHLCGHREEKRSASAYG